ncbi:hypothetical protein [Kribbella sp. NPDC049227]|uniref:hypothetical protein n=1 Tax=Kribbella sp. NPDC049227 TaxID=3364113 RepID=UPI003711CB88
MSRSALFAAAIAVATTTALGLTSATTATGAPTADPAPTPAAAVARAKAAIGDNLAVLRATGSDAFVVRTVLVDPDGPATSGWTGPSAGSRSSAATSSCTRPRTAAGRAPA